jgi:phosphopantothenoylcysteine decarboxylase/phosphopantothenate--cysteine ligase
MGFALAEVCAKQGAEVCLVTGPVQMKTIHPNIERVDVESAAQMFEEVTNRFYAADGAILCAAVADFTPKHTAEAKIKREKDDLVLELKPTQDIAAFVGEMKSGSQFIIGFALETNNEVANAQSKMERKNFDFIVLNSLRDEKAGFGFDTNKISIIHRSGETKQFELKNKQAVAEDIVAEIVRIL